MSEQDIVDTAVNSVQPNQRASGRRTKEQWLSVAKNLGTQLSDMSDSEIERYAYKTWQELKPNQKANLNRQGQGYVEFKSNEWIKAVKNTAKEAKARTNLTTQAEQVSKLPTQESVENVQKMKYNDTIRKPQNKNYVYKKITNQDRARLSSDYMENSKKYVDDIGSVDFDDVSYIYQKNGNDIEILKKFKGSQEFINKIKGEWGNGIDDISEGSIKVDEGVRNEKRKSNISNGSFGRTEGSRTSYRENIGTGRQGANLDGEQASKNNSRNLKDSNKSSFSLPATDNQGRTKNNLKQKQLDIIQKYNPMRDDYHTGIRTIEDINDYKVEVVTAITSNNNEIFYDIVDIEPTKIETSSNRRTAKADPKIEDVSKNSIAPKEPTVNTDYAQNNKVDTADKESAFSMPKNKLETQADKLASSKIENLFLIY